MTALKQNMYTAKRLENCVHLAANEVKRNGRRLILK